MLLRKFSRHGFRPSAAWNGVPHLNLRGLSPFASMGAIQEYRDRGAGAWSPTHPCSDFAADIWERVTGEDLSSWWIWDIPSDLVEVIRKANGGSAIGILKKE